METKDSLPEILTVREAAAYARVTPRTVQRWIEESRVPGVKVGGTVRIRRDDLLAVLTPSIDISLSSPFYNLYRPTPPPKLDKEDQLFKRDNVDGRLTASIGGISSNWGIYADGYRMAGNTLLECLIDMHLRHQGGDFKALLIHPIMELYRHAIELSIKEILEVSTDLLDTNEDLQDNDLTNLWSRCRKILEITQFTDSTHVHNATHDDLDAVEEYIKQLHEIDPNSRAFRYPVNEDSSPSHREQIEIGLTNFREKITAIGALLDKGSKWIHACLDVKRESQDY